MSVLGVGIGLGLLLISSLLGGISNCSAQAFTVYVPPVLDEFRVPTSACVDADYPGDPPCFPKLWVWDNGRINLAGVPFLVQSPPAKAWTAQQGPRTTHLLTVNYWGWKTGGIWNQQTFSGYNDATKVSFLPDSVTHIDKVYSGAVIDSIMDSVYAGHAWLIVTNALWSRPDTLTSGFSLVPQSFTVASGP